MALAPNVKALRALLKANDARAVALRAAVPLSTLRRHVEGKKLPEAKWLLRYSLAFGWRPEDWLSGKAYKKEQELTHSWCFADLVQAKEGGAS